VATALAQCDPDAISVQPGTMFQDGCGRQRFFRGANVVTKLAPYVPPTSYFDPATSFAKEDAALYQSLGWNLIRLGTMWPGVQPTSAAINQTYLEALTTLSSIAAEFGIYSILDAHQDSLSNQFCGEGMPAWVARIAAAGSLPFPQPIQNTTFINSPDGLPTPQECGTIADWTSIYFTSAAGQAFQYLYQDVRGIRTIFQSFWQAVVKAYSKAPAVSPSGANGVAKSLYSSAVAMIEVLNEPWAGDTVKNLWLLIPGVADKQNLQPFYYNVTAAIRSVEPVGEARRIVSYESVTYDDFIPVGFTSLPDSDKGLSTLVTHYYNLPNFNVEWQITARVKDAQRLNSGLILNEFDLGDQDLEAIQHTIDVADASRVSWTGWEYKSSFITGADESFWNSDGSVNTTRARVMARPGPNAVGGDTQSYVFNSTSAAFVLNYTLTAAAIQATPQLGTVVYVPTGLWYNCSGNCLEGALNVTVSTNNPNSVSWKLDQFAGAVVPADKDNDAAYVNQQIYNGQGVINKTTGAYVPPNPFAYALLTVVPSSVDASLAGSVVTVTVRPN
jgi:endoglycosylceramidase